MKGAGVGSGLPGVGGGDAAGEGAIRRFHLKGVEGRREYAGPKKPIAVPTASDEAAPGAPTASATGKSGAEGAEGRGVRERKALMGSYAVYLDQNGRLYDLYYHPLSSSSASSSSGIESTAEKERARTPIKVSSPVAARRANLEVQNDPRKSALLQDLHQNAFDPARQLWRSFPTAESEEHPNYEAYEQAVIEWLVKVEKEAGYLMLPFPMGCAYYRPRIRLEERSPLGGEQDDEKTSESASDLSPRGSIRTDDPATVSSSIQPHTADLTEDPWDTLLIPAEPHPSLYATYQEYVEALIRWAQACATTASFIPPHASQFAELLPIAIPEDKAQRKRGRTTGREEKGSDSRSLNLVAFHQRTAIPDDFLFDQQIEEMMRARKLGGSMEHSSLFDHIQPHNAASLVALRQERLGLALTRQRASTERKWNHLSKNSQNLIRELVTFMADKREKQYCTDPSSSSLPLLAPSSPSSPKTRTARASIHFGSTSSRVSSRNLSSIRPTSSFTPSSEATQGEVSLSSAKSGSPIAVPSPSSTRTTSNQDDAYLSILGASIYRNHQKFEVGISRKRTAHAPASFNGQLLPVIHGTFPRTGGSLVPQPTASPASKRRGTSASSSTDARRRNLSKTRSQGDTKKALSIAHNHKDEDTSDGAITNNSTLRRTDYEPDVLMSLCGDCPTRVDNREVEYNMKDHDLEEPIDFKRLLTPTSTPAYRAEIIQYLRFIQTSSRYDHLNSWYHPLVSPETQKQHRERIKKIITKAADKVTLEDLQRVLGEKLKEEDWDTPQQEMFLDEFERFMSEPSPIIDDSGESSLTYLELAMRPLDADTFPHLLSLFYTSNSLHVHSKLALVVSQTLQLGRGKRILQSLVSQHDLRSLYYTARGLLFLDEIPKDVYPFPSDLAGFVKSFNLNEPEWLSTAVKDIFALYYVSLLAGVMAAKSFLYVQLRSFIESLINDLGERVSVILNEHPEFMREGVFRAMGNRSTRISSHALLIVLQLLHSTNTNVKKVLKAPETNLVNNIVKLSLSKFLSNQFAASRLFATLQQKEWKNVLFFRYKKPNLVLQDLLQKPLSQASVKPNLQSSLLSQSRGKASLLSTLVTNMCLAALEMIGWEDRDSRDLFWILNGSLFVDLLNKVLSASYRTHVHIHAAPLFEQSKKDYKGRSKEPIEKVAVGGQDAQYRLDDETIVNISCILAQMSKVLYRLSLIKEADPSSKEKTGMGGREVLVSEEDLGRLLNFIDHTSYPSPNYYIVRTNILIVLRNFLKVPQIFNFVKKDTKFFATIIQFCREQKNEGFSKNAWRLMYQGIRYHSGHIEFLINSDKLLDSWLDIIAVHAGQYAILHGLHYLTKLFLLPTLEVEREANKGKSARGATGGKSLERDLKKLAKFFDKRHLFIKIHMIYKASVGSAAAGKEDAPKGAGSYDVSRGHNHAVFAKVAQFYHALTLSPIALPLLKNLQKVEDYAEELRKVPSMYVATDHY